MKKLTRIEKKARVLEAARRLSVELGGTGIIDLRTRLFPTAKYLNANNGDLYDSGGTQMFPAFVNPNSVKVVDALAGINFPKVASPAEAENYFLTR